MSKRKKPAEPLFAIWLDGRRIGGAFPLGEALALLGACARRWERENASAMTELGAVRSVDGSLYLGAPVLMRRDDDKPLTDDDWEIVRMRDRHARERPWAEKIQPRKADRIVAGWSWGVEWEATPGKPRARSMEPDEDAERGMFAAAGELPWG